MPAVSKAQRRFAAMSRSPEGRARLKRMGKKPMPSDVAGEFDKGSEKGLPERKK